LNVVIAKNIKLLLLFRLLITKLVLVNRALYFFLVRLLYFIILDTL